MSVIKTMTKSNLGREEFIESYSVQTITKESQDRNSGGDLEAGTD